MSGICVSLMLTQAARVSRGSEGDIRLQAWTMLTPWRGDRECRPFLDAAGADPAAHEEPERHPGDPAGIVQAR